VSPEIDNSSRCEIRAGISFLQAKNLNAEEIQLENTLLTARIYE
jgi:hypothetical protein